MQNAIYISNQKLQLVSVDMQGKTNIKKSSAKACL
mgnify:CR=1 FL=1|jgi:hypothetical protein